MNSNWVDGLVSETVSSGFLKTASDHSQDDQKENYTQTFDKYADEFGGKEFKEPEVASMTSDQITNAVNDFHTVAAVNPRNVKAGLQRLYPTMTDADFVTIRNAYWEPVFNGMERIAADKAETVFVGRAELNEIVDDLTELAAQGGKESDLAKRAYEKYHIDDPLLQNELINRVAVHIEEDAPGAYFYVTLVPGPKDNLEKIVNKIVGGRIEISHGSFDNAMTLMVNARDAEEAKAYVNDALKGVGISITSGLRVRVADNPLDHRDPNEKYLSDPNLGLAHPHTSDPGMVQMADGESKKCLNCDKDFTPENAGQDVCSDACFKAYVQKHRYDHVKKSASDHRFNISAVYDNGGETADRYTVVVDEMVDGNEVDRFNIMLSEDALSPQGVNMIVDSSVGGSGTPIDFEALPDDVQTAVNRRLDELKRAGSYKQAAEPAQPAAPAQPQAPAAPVQPEQSSQDVEEMVRHRISLEGKLSEINSQIEKMRATMTQTILPLQQQVGKEEPALIAALKKMDDMSIMVDGWKAMISAAFDRVTPKYKDILAKVEEVADKEAIPRITNLIKQLKGTDKYLSVSNTPERLMLREIKPTEKKSSSFDGWNFGKEAAPITQKLREWWAMIVGWFKRDFNPELEKLEDSLHEINDYLEVMETGAVAASMERSADKKCPDCGEAVWDVSTPDQRLNKCWSCGLRFDNDEGEDVEASLAVNAAFNDKSVLKEMAAALGTDKDSLTIKDQSDGSKLVTYGDQEYYVYKSDDAAEAIALERVKEDLENEPGIFNQDWLNGHIDKEGMAQELADEDWQNWADVRDEKDGKELNAEEGVDSYEAGKTYYATEIFSGEWKTEEELVSSYKDGILDEFDVYFPPEKLKEHINIEEAAEDAIRTDGWQHFMSSYDGNSYDLPSGAVYVRHN